MRRGRDAIKGAGRQRERGLCQTMSSVQDTRILLNCRPQTFGYGVGPGASVSILPQMLARSPELWALNLGPRLNCVPTCPSNRTQSQSRLNLSSLHKNRRPCSPVQPRLSSCIYEGICDLVVLSKGSVKLQAPPPSKTLDRAVL